MNNYNNPIKRLINKIDAIFVFILLALLSVTIDGTIIYGISHSSLVSQEKGFNEIVKESKNNIHVKYSLGHQSEAAKISLINPINEYNAYRAKEYGRWVSYVLNEEFEVNYEEVSFNSNYVVYADYYNNGVTMSRFPLSTGTYANMSQDNIVYVSPAFLKQTGIETKKAVGKMIKLSFNEEPYMIGGIIKESNGDDSAPHFKRLFDESYILLNSAQVYKYGFTDLLFTTTDDYFVNDSLDFVKAYNKSYLKFKDIYMRVSSYLWMKKKKSPRIILFLILLIPVLGLKVMQNLTSTHSFLFLSYQSQFLSF